jgi:hypothetical protein
MVAGPYFAWDPSVSVSVIALADPPDGNATDGARVVVLAGAKLFPAWGAHPSFAWGPPNRPTLVMFAQASPLTDVIGSAAAGLAPPTASAARDPVAITAARKERPQERSLERIVELL